MSMSVSPSESISRTVSVPAPVPVRWPARGARPVVVMLTIVVALVVLGAPAPSAGAGASCWPPPVDGVVIDPFREPPCSWCAGNRGLEYRTDPGAVVRAATAGTVTFAGTVAGTTYVVVGAVDGRRLTYGRLADRTVATGDRVGTGTVLGHAAGELFFGMRVGGRYVDPAPHLGRLVGRPRLIPIDGRAARAAPAPRLACDVATVR